MASVTFNNVSFNFGNKKVFSNLSLEVKDGEILGIVGPGSCGKTTLIRCLAGLLNPSSGEILIDDQIVFSHDKHISIKPEKRKIGMVFQDYAVWPHKSVSKNIEYPLAKHKIAKSEREKIIAHALKQVRMSSYANYMPAQLSGGQQQRVAIARALVSSKKLIVMDEPITNLDAKLREEMIEEIRQIQHDLGTTIIYITHDQEAALKLCDRIAIMQQDGKIVQVANDETIIKQPANRFVFEFIGVSNFIPLIVNAEKVYIKQPKQNILWPDAPIDEILQLTKANSLDMGIRPLDIVFSDNSPLKATVKSVVFLGNQYNYFVRLGDLELRVQVSTLDALKQGIFSEGQEVGIKFAKAVYYPSNSVLLDKENATCEA
ncbi:ABC transporter ATP-binding protein [Amygdalobacter nucleatus]|uniref:ABC-type quaternary amine transporter n=1 Tax=Amygdalobacter nucleatus TaxID=3029274 RepID=A0A133YFR2_9FIRM|nr:ABC transporter ATP-binding protein [Amygdalobacter nucleatus]KXB42025.1 ABC transporter, ATP-binding protein [Amygdalobacter nucleatus]MDF0485682.1 ABC transporter ATP-binding protein [Amygdalobacter nucleatus]